MNLAVRDIRHNLGRFLLTCVGLSLLLGIVLSMIAIYRGLVAEALTVSRVAGADVWVVEARTRGPFAESSRLPDDTRAAIASLWGVAGAGSVVYQTVEATHDGRTLRLQVIGIETDRPGRPPAVVAGRPIMRSRYEAIADRRTGLVLGERITLGRDVFRVVGLTDGIVASGGDPVIFITLRDAQVLQSELAPPAARRELARGAASGATGTVNAVVVDLQAGVSPEAFASEVRRWKHLSALTQAEQETVLTRSVVERARRQIGLFTALLMVVSTVIITLIIYTLTIDKKKSIATLKLIGAPDTTIVGLILQQALAMGAIGFVAGSLMIHAVKDYFPRRLVLEAADAVTLFVIVMLACVLASGLGIRTALRIDPATALAG
ncbi:ABC transporter permease [Prosthecomicrobium sp. N25]|uniref:ABC transporter permease n=1 Tax=Prosthecomicrobium sp. N25 TaxID=3129254 RepID=UPI0030771AF8